MFTQYLAAVKNENPVLVEAVLNGYTAINESVYPDKHKKFFTFVESLATESTVDDLVTIVEAYCVSNQIDSTVLTEAWQDFARKHGGKVKAFMAGLMLLASVANAGNVQTTQDHGTDSYSGKGHTQMTSGHDGDGDAAKWKAEGIKDAKELVKKLSDPKTSDADMQKMIGELKGDATHEGYIDGVETVMKALKQAGIVDLNMDKIFGDAGHSDAGHGDGHAKAGDGHDVKKSQTTVKDGKTTSTATSDQKAQVLKELAKVGAESDDEGISRSQASDALRSVGLSERDLAEKGYELQTSEHNGTFVTKLAQVGK